MVKTNQFHIGHLVVVVYDHRDMIDDDVVDLADNVLDVFFDIPDPSSSNDWRNI